ncbi:MAG: serine/threonine protein kinase [Planctomycetes bacterium]|nr:serine/threonine protein kinase [Planctomycetota bacterium]
MPVEPPGDVKPHLGDPRRRLGRHILVERIGKGGQSEVWRAWDEALARYVAIKILRDADAEDVARFRREANIVGRLNHPNIAPVFAMDHEGDRCWIAMQLVDGATIDACDAPLTRKLGWVRDAARALEFAHAQGIVHRDMKPSNVMIDPDGRAFLLDFGIARPLRRGATVTQTDMLVGTPAFMSPEQARGRRVDARSDVYGLGATLYRLATHSDPFYSEDPMQLLLKVANETPPRPRTLEPSIPRAVEDIIRIAMSKDPGRRYATAAELADQIDLYLAGKRVRGAPRDPVRIPQGAWIAAFALVAVAAVAWALFRPGPRDPSPGPPPANAPAAGHALDYARSIIESLYRQSDLKPEIRARRVQDARENLAAALLARPGDPAALLEAARLEAIAGTADAALAAADAAVAADPESPMARLLRARLRFKRALALKTRRIAALEPAGTDAASFARLASEAATPPPEVRRAFAEADEDLATFRSSAVGGQEAEAAFAIGLDHFNAGRFAEAAIALAAATDSPWVGADAQLLLGIAAYVAGDFSKGEAALAQGGRGDEAVATRLLLSMLLAMEGFRQTPGSAAALFVDKLIQRNFSELVKLRPRSADWLQVVPMSRFWRGAFARWIGGR